MVFPPMHWMRVLSGVAALLLLVPVSVHAQIIVDDPPPRTEDEWYLRLSPGVTLSETDVDDDGPGSLGFNAELGYQYKPEFSVGGSFTYAEYPNAILSQPDSIFSASSPLDLGTAMVLLRWMPRPDWRLSPYFNVGPQITFNEQRAGVGLTTGLGLDYVLNDRFSVYTDFSAYHSAPDDAIDGQDVDWALISFFDTFVHWGFGLRTSLKGRPDPIDDLIIEGPDPVCAGSPATFSARVDEEAARPITYAWDLGDGAQARGMSIDHIFRSPGRYTLSVTASNPNGSEEASMTVNALPSGTTGQEAPRVLSLTADTTTVRVSQLVRFNAHLKGTSPIDVRWTFGNGTSATEQVTVEAENENPCQRRAPRVDERLSQATAYDAPGTYTVTMNASGPAGRDQRTLTIRVIGEPVAADACADLIPRQTVYFGFDLDFLNAAQEEKLRRMVEPLRQCPQARVRLVGHTDWVDTRSYNVDLGRRRAETVKRYFTQRGIDGSRFITETEGERGHQPPCPEDDPGPGCQAYRFTETIVMMNGLWQQVASNVRPQTPSSTADRPSRERLPGTRARPSAGAYRSAPTETRAPASGYRPGMWDRDRGTDTMPSISVVEGDGSVRSYVGEMESEPFGVWTLVIGSFSSLSNARAAAQRSREDLHGVSLPIVIRTDDEENLYRVTLGTFETLDRVLTSRRTLRARIPEGAWMMWIPESGDRNVTYGAVR